MARHTLANGRRSGTAFRDAGPYTRRRVRSTGIAPPTGNAITAGRSERTRRAAAATSAPPRSRTPDRRHRLPSCRRAAGAAAATARALGSVGPLGPAALAPDLAPGGVPVETVVALVPPREPSPSEL